MDENINEKVQENRENKTKKENVESIECQQKEKQKLEEKQKTFLSSEWYNRNYKKLLIFTFLLFFTALVYLVIFYVQHGDIMYKDVTLTGGTTITVYSDVDTKQLEAFLKPKLKEIHIRKLEDISTRRTIAFIVETQSDANTAKKALEEYLGYELNSSNSSIEISGPTLARAFFKQLLIAMVIAFLLMATVVFIIFKTFVPSAATVFCALFDVIGALTIANLFHFRISTAGIAAFLMLVGYSIDTDIMLTTKTIKRRGEGDTNSRIKSALKTGLVMTLTSLVAVLLGYFIAEAEVLKEIFFILSCGLFADLIGTWMGNASIIKWYCEKKKIS